MSRPLAAILPLLLAAAMVSAAPASAVDLNAEKRIKFIDPSFDTVFFPVNVNNWWGAMNQRGRLVIYPQFDWADDVYDGWVRIVVEGRTGYIRSALRGTRDLENSSLIITPRFDYGDRFQEKFAAVGVGGRFGFIDVAGRMRTRLIFDEALRFKENLAAVRLDERCGFIDVSGRVAVPLRFVRVRSFHENMAMVELPGTEDRSGVMGYIGRSGRFIWRDDEHRFDDLGDFHDGYAKALSGDKWGYIDKTGLWRIGPQYDDARDFHRGFAAVLVGERWGYVDKTGRLAIAPRFDAADDFDDILAMVTLDDRIGFVNKAGALTIPPRFVYAEPYFRRYARVSTESNFPSFAYIDTAGNVIWDPRQALDGFVDVTTRQRILMVITAFTLKRIGPTGQGSPVLLPPPPRDPILPPYPPDYLYVEELPQPLSGEGR